MSAQLVELMLRPEARQLDTRCHRYLKVCLGAWPDLAISPLTWGYALERVTGIEPALSAWEADVLPLNYTRASWHLPRSIIAASACAVFAQISYRTR